MAVRRMKGFSGFCSALSCLATGHACLVGCSSPTAHDGEDDVAITYVVREGNGDLFLGDKRVPRIEVSEEIRMLELREDVITASVALRAEPLFGPPPNDTRFRDDRWAFEAIQLYSPDGPDAQDLSKGSGVQVGVADSGFSKNKDLVLFGGWDVTQIYDARRERSAPDLTAQDYRKDKDGHGTLVAGIVGAKENNKHAIAGAAPEVSLVGIRTPGVTRAISQVAQPHVYGLPYEVQVLNISQGNPEAKFPPAAAALMVETAVQNGVLIVAAAGNSAIDGNPVMYPAAIPNVLGVGALNREAGFPARATSERGFYVDLSAPGQEIVSTTLPWLFEPYATVGASGTSFAAPFVASAAALLISYLEQDCRPKETSALRRHCVMNIARRLQSTAVQAGENIWTADKGAGLLQVYSAMTTDESELLLPTPPLDFSAEGQFNDDTLGNRDVQLAWSAPHSGEVAHYAVYRDGKQLTVTDKPQYTDSIAEPLQGDILYQVTAVNTEKGESFAAPLWRCFLVVMVSFDDNDEESREESYDCRQEFP